MWLSFLNIFFFVFHTALTLLNICGWAFRKTRKLHLITLLLTAASWFVLGIWYGWGYCLCTDWHWKVREAMGYDDRSNSYIHFLLLNLTGKDFGARMVEDITATVFFICTFLSIYFNIRDYKIMKTKKPDYK
jgi:hypothetical protein